MNTCSRATRATRSAASKLWGRIKRQAPDLTVVVPVYNVEDYLEECLDSILEESEIALQIIAVDDGSTDGSSRILERAAKRDRRIEIIRKANAGLGAARNTGALRARGRYISFIDSDDVVERGAFKRVIEILDQTRRTSRSRHIDTSGMGGCRTPPSGFAPSTALGRLPLISTAGRTHLRTSSPGARYIGLFVDLVGIR